MLVPIGTIVSKPCDRHLKCINMLQAAVLCGHICIVEYRLPIVAMNTTCHLTCELAAYLSNASIPCADTLESSVQSQCLMCKHSICKCAMCTEPSLFMQQVLNLGQNNFEGRLRIIGMSSLRALMLNDNKLTGVDGEQHDCSIVRICSQVADQPDAPPFPAPICLAKPCFSMYMRCSDGSASIKGMQHHSADARSSKALHFVQQRRPLAYSQASSS